MEALCSSWNGAAGAFFLAILAPTLFSGDYEVSIALGCCGVLIRIVLRQDRATGSSWHAGKRSHLLASILIVALCASLYVGARRQATDFQSSARKFYGVLRIEDVSGPPLVLLQGGTSVAMRGGPGYRKLINGTMEHGVQFISEHRKRKPSTYYEPRTGAAMALKAAGTQHPIRVGVIGLDAGTLAACGRPHDTYTFFEINPLVLSYAQKQFTFLKDTPAKTEIRKGGARLSLERNDIQPFDVLVVDAFSGDSIPTHLLTRQAFLLYLRKLNFTGLIAVHVSNRYLNLAPIVLAAAQSLHLDARVIENSRDTGHAIYPATWVVLGRPGGPLQRPESNAFPMLRAMTAKSGDLWTDHYSSILKTLQEVAIGLQGRVDQSQDELTKRISKGSIFTPLRRRVKRRKLRACKCHGIHLLDDPVYDRPRCGIPLHQPKPEIGDLYVDILGRAAPTLQSLLPICG